MYSCKALCNVIGADFVLEIASRYSLGQGLEDGVTQYKYYSNVYTQKQFVLYYVVKG